MRGGTSRTPGPAVSPGTATATAPCRGANQRPSRRPTAGTSCWLLGRQAAPGTAAGTEQGPRALHATKVLPDKGHQERRHLGERCAGALSIPNPPRTYPICPRRPCVALSIPNLL